jgi:hypothetical protein
MTEKLTFPQWDEIAPKIEIEEDDEISEEEFAKGFLCIDCGKDTIDDECYMVTDELWAASGVGPDGGMLCLACLERRTGRELTLADFTAIA